MKVSEPTFERGFVAYSGHPCPEVFRDGDRIDIVCNDEDEAFHPPVESPITMAIRSFRMALERANADLEEFTRRIEASEAEGSSIARRLVFG